MKTKAPEYQPDRLKEHTSTWKQKEKDSHENTHEMDEIMDRIIPYTTAQETEHRAYKVVSRYYSCQEPTYGNCGNTENGKFVCGIWST
jgi:hypothetical protein